MRINRKWCGLIFAAVSFSSLPLFVQASDKAAVTLLSTMSSAMQTLNYEGTFVQVRNGHTDLIHILHAYDEHGKSERMRSLNGEAREVIRNDASVICIWPGSSDVIVSNSKPRTLQSPLGKTFTENSNYLIEHGGVGRVAGLDADIIDVTPVDDLRYGYRFWADKDTGMMLRAMVLGSDNIPVEELMFTAIEYLDTIDQERFSVDVDAENIQQVDTETAGANDSHPVVDKVSFQDLPEGFEERSETLRMVAVRKDSPVSHVVVSDGFSIVSVYVEYVARANHDPSALGSTHMGAVNAYGLSLPEALVTVVGEVPGKTAEVIARAARLVN